MLSVMVSMSGRMLELVMLLKTLEDSRLGGFAGNYGRIG